MNSSKTVKKKSEPKIRPSMKKDRIKASDFLKYKIPLFCEDCSHFKSENTSCTLGFKTEPHLKVNALKTYELTEHVPQCRFLEID